MGSQIYYTTNPGEYDDLEGVIVSEQTPPGFIEAADINGVGMTGVCLKGPVDTPVDIDSEKTFLSIFGHRDRASGGDLVNEVWQALLNKPFGPRLTVVRAAAAAAATAEMDFVETATPIINIAASSPGAWGNDLTAAIEAASNGDATMFDLVLTYRGETRRHQNLNTETGFDNLLATIGNGNDVWVTVTKLADGRPDNAVAAALTDTAGADGTIADSDYTGTDRALDQIADVVGLGSVLVAQRSTTAIKAALLVKAAAAVDRMFLMWNGNHAETDANVDTDAQLYSSDRIVYCTNSPYIIDPETAAEVQVAPHTFMASIFSQTAPEQHVAHKRTFKQTAAIQRLTRDMSRAVLIAHKANGVCALEKVTGGFKFRSGVTTNLTAGLTEIARRRQADFLQVSASERLVDFVGDLDVLVGDQILGELTAFCEELRDTPRIVEDFSIIGEAVTAGGVKVIRWRVKLYKHILHLVLQTEIGTGVTTEVGAAAA